MDSEKKYRLVVDNANEGIVITQDGMLKFVNPQIREFTGFSENNLKAGSFLDYIFKSFPFNHYFSKFFLDAYLSFFG